MDFTLFIVCVGGGCDVEVRGQLEGVRFLLLPVGLEHWIHVVVSAAVPFTG